MPRNSGGTCTRTMVGGYVAGNTALASDVNTEVNDIITMLTDSLSRSGFGGMNGNKISNLGNGTTSTDAAACGQLAFPPLTGLVQMPFYMASPPNGWTPVDQQHDSMMRIVNHNGVGTDAGGTSQIGAGHSPIYDNITADHTHYVSIGTTNPGDHSHSISAPNTTSSTWVSGGGYALVWDTNTYGGTKPWNTTTASAGGHTHTASGWANWGTTGDGAGNHGNGTFGAWQPKYCNFCIGSRTF